MSMRAFQKLASNQHFFCPTPCPFLQDGVVLGADTRSTAGSTVADKNCEKIHYIAPNIFCCGAGTAADTENVTGICTTACHPLLL